MFNASDIDRFRAELQRRGVTFAETTASQHFRFPVPASFEYRLLASERGRVLCFALDGCFAGVRNGTTPERASFEDLTDDDVAAEVARALA